MRQYSCVLRIRKKGAERIVFRGNPIYKKEVRTGMRTARVAALIVGFNTILAIVAFVMFSNTIDGISNSGVLDYSGLADLYTVMAYIEFGIIAIVVPAITAGSVVGERERQTLDVMLASKVRPFSIVWGKMLSCAQLIVTVCVSSLPVLSIVFVYGGIRITNLLMLLFADICIGCYFGSIGVFASCISKRTTTAVITAYVGMVAVIVLTGGIVYVGGAFNVMLLNPAATIVGLVGGQLEVENFFEELLFYGIARNGKERMENWTVCSIAAQLIFSTALLLISAWILNPLKFGLWRRLKKLYGNRKNKKDVISD